MNANTNTANINTNILGDNSANSANNGTSRTRSLFYFATLVLIISVVTFHLMVANDASPSVTLIGIALMIGSFALFGYLSMSALSSTNMTTLGSLFIITIIICWMSYSIGHEMNVSGAGFMVTVLMLILGIMALNMIGDKYNRLLKGVMLTIGAMLTWLVFMRMSP